jgi:hypothetical protein
MQIPSAQLPVWLSVQVDAELDIDWADVLDAQAEGERLRSVAPSPGRPAPGVQHRGHPCSDQTGVLHLAPRRPTC